VVLLRVSTFAGSMVDRSCFVSGRKAGVGLRVDGPTEKAEPEACHHEEREVTRRANWFVLRSACREVFGIAGLWKAGHYDAKVILWCGNCWPWLFSEG
jgi:hypothetical protein